MPDEPLTLGLNKPAEPSALPPAEGLQFDRALPVSATRVCVACKQVLSDEYYHAEGQVVCPLCAQRIQAQQQAPPTISIVPAALYGAGAALAGCVLYAAVAIVTDLQIGIIAIVVGMMVGKAIRHASRGLGGRRQQILAVALTYLGITTSYIPVFIYDVNKHPEQFQQQRATKGGSTQDRPPGSDTSNAPSRMSPGAALLYLLALVLAAPILGVFSNPVSGLITIFIIVIGLRQAWRLTGRTDLSITGPYRVSQT